VEDEDIIKADRRPASRLTEIRGRARYSLLLGGEYCTWFGEFGWLLF